MTHRHAIRRGVAPRPSDKDLRRWRRLLKRIEPIVANPMARALPMVIAAEEANAAIMPVGHQGPGSVFSMLVRRCEPYLKLGPVQRVEAAEAIGLLAEQCREILDDGPDAPGVRRRKDIDG